uniref:Uncharacterized protein n=1 Tax=Noctiluca scintillans TaxID=2966 RepID=A0A7S1A7M7_NOCSC
MGVEFAVVLELCRALIILGALSSQKQLVLADMIVGTTEQVLLMAFTLVGVPIAIAAGVGVLFRMASHVTFFCWYRLAVFVYDLCFCARALALGVACWMVLGEFRMRGDVSFFVCVFFIIASLFWIVVFLLFDLYLVFTLWSESEILRSDEFREIVKYGTIEGVESRCVIHGGGENKRAVSKMPFGF